MKIDRLISMLLTLVNREKVTAKELAEKFEVSIRTVQRDMDTLSAAGIPVYSDVGKSGGYSLLENYKIDKSFLKNEEASLLMSFINSLVKAVPNSDVKSIYQKLVTSLPEEQNNEYRKFIFQINPWVEDTNFNNQLKELSQAIEERNRVKIEYYDLDNNKTKRLIEPYSLIMKGGTWYLHAYCKLRNDFRLFKLSRITDQEILVEKFTISESFKPWEYADSEEIHTERIVLVFKDTVRGRLLDHFNKEQIEYGEKEIRVVVHYPDDEWLYSLLLSFVPYVKVIEPEHVRDKFVQKLMSGLEMNN
ncbi:helix-turn-helix transcriptional regulator [Oceanirhabdus sp. W0125-5]|uniref:helix-turn-helix transcriptional regulator n=1 Tax=Oceanirhabdus sp. W0125-5 TaxID=2999116 RepID=UPI0022F2FB6C|nr:YafY family protein [Oceanirhabdus sp. W0125-5]WBW95599.1 YafY family protein [Oceanirhabdus sp. W0125-5]